MKLLRFTTPVERALAAEATIDGGHEDSITPSYLRRYPFFRRNVYANGSPKYVEKRDQKGGSGYAA